MADLHEVYDIIIVGAGLSGLSCAYYATKKTDKLKILVIEDKYGGRLLPSPIFKYGDLKFTRDLGGEWISRQQIFIDWLIEDLKMKCECHQTNEGKVNVLNLNFKRPPLLPLNSEKTNCSLIMTDEALIKTYTDKSNIFSSLQHVCWLIYLKKIKSLLSLLSSQIYYSKYMENNMVIRDKLDAYTLGAYNNNISNSLLLSKSRKQLMDVVHRMLFGKETNQIPFTFYLLYSLPLISLSPGGIYEPILTGPSRKPNISKSNQKNSSVLAGRPLRIKGGSRSICDKIVKHLETSNVQVLLSKRLTAVTQDGDNKIFTLKVADTHEHGFKCKKIIFGIPPVCLKDISFDLSAPLPAQLNTLLAQFQPGRILKFVLIYPIPFWRNLNYTGQVVNGVCEKGQKLKGVSVDPARITTNELDVRYSYFNTPAQKFYYRADFSLPPFDYIYDSTPSEADSDDLLINNSNSPKSGDLLKNSNTNSLPQKTFGSLSGFIGGDNYDFWADKTPEERFCAITAYLNFVWKTTKAKESLHYYEKDWVTEDLCYGGPVGVPATGYTKYILLLREPHDKSIYFGGTEAADFDVGSMSGAVQAGVRCAAACLIDNWPELIDGNELDDIRIPPDIIRSSSNLTTKLFGTTQNSPHKSTFFDNDLSGSSNVGGTDLKIPLLIANIFNCLFCSY